MVEDGGAGTPTSPLPGQIFDAAVMHSLRYPQYGATGRRWARPRHVRSREAELLEFLGRTLDTAS